MIDIDDEVKEIVPPYWWVEYIDVDKTTHIAFVKNDSELEYLKNNFTIIEVRLIAG